MNNTVRYINIADVFDVTLKSNASTGYLWYMTSPDFQVIKSAPLKPFDPVTMAVGSSIDMVYTMKPKRTGELRLRFEKRRPWEKKTEPLEDYEEVIMVAE